jgi:hypothetical protein
MPLRASIANRITEPPNVPRYAIDNAPGPRGHPKPRFGGTAASASGFPYGPVRARDRAASAAGAGPVEQNRKRSGPSLLAAYASTSCEEESSEVPKSSSPAAGLLKPVGTLG